MKKGKLQFTSHTRNLAMVRNEVRKFAELCQFPQKQCLLVVLGVDEACTNIIRYAYALRDDQPITLSMERLRDCIRIRLRDYGTQRSVRVGEISPGQRVKPGGLGLHLIRAAFDRVNYILKARGTELVLTKNLEM